MVRAWVRCLLVSAASTGAGMAAGCAGDTTAPMSANRPELVFAEVDTGTFTTRLMGYSASQGVWELAPGEANLPEPTQYWWLRPTTGQVLLAEPVRHQHRHRPAPAQPARHVRNIAAWYPPSAP